MTPDGLPAFAVEVDCAVTLKRVVQARSWRLASIASDASATDLHAVSPGNLKMPVHDPVLANLPGITRRFGGAQPALLRRHGLGMTNSGEWALALRAGTREPGVVRLIKDTSRAREAGRGGSRSASREWAVGVVARLRSSPLQRQDRAPQTIRIAAIRTPPGWFGQVNEVHLLIGVAGCHRLSPNHCTRLLPVEILTTQASSPNDLS